MAFKMWLVTLRDHIEKEVGDREETRGGRSLAARERRCVNVG